MIPGHLPIPSPDLDALHKKIIKTIVELDRTPLVKLPRWIKREKKGLFGLLRPRWDALKWQGNDLIRKILKQMRGLEHLVTSVLDRTIDRFPADFERWRKETEAIVSPLIIASPLMGKGKSQKFNLKRFQNKKYKKGTSKGMLSRFIIDLFTLQLIFVQIIILQRNQGKTRHG